MLHDVWVRKCYLGTTLVPRKADCSWADYMVAVSLAIREDLVSQEPLFADLGTAVATQLGLKTCPVTDVRLLDIVAWSSQGGSRT